MAAIDENAEISLDDVGNLDNADMKQAVEQMETAGENYFGESWNRAHVIFHYF